jgi:hypothetical protein
VAPWIRNLQRRGQLALAIELGAIAVFGSTFIVILFYRRRHVEQRAGPLLLAVNRSHASWIHAIISLGVVSAIGVAGWNAVDQALAHSSLLPLLKPNLLVFGFLGANYVVVKLWWGFDPLTLEVREAGFVLGGLQFMPWDSIVRYTLSGTPPKQLNLFTTARLVVNIPLERAAVPQLESTMQRRLSSTSE